MKAIVEKVRSSVRRKREHMASAELRHRLQQRKKALTQVQKQIFERHAKDCAELAFLVDSTLPRVKRDAVYRLRRLLSFGLGEYREIFAERAQLTLLHTNTLIACLDAEVQLILKYRLEVEENLRRIEAALQSNQNLEEELHRPIAITPINKLVDTDATIMELHAIVEQYETDLESLHHVLGTLEQSLRLPSAKERKRRMRAVLTDYEKYANAVQSSEMSRLSFSETTRPEDTVQLAQSTFDTLLRGSIIVDTNADCTIIQNDRTHGLAYGEIMYKRASYASMFQPHRSIVTELNTISHSDQNEDAQIGLRQIRGKILWMVESIPSDHTMKPSTILHAPKIALYEVYSNWQREAALQQRFNSLCDDQRFREGRFLYKWCRRLFGFDVSLLCLHKILQLSSFKQVVLSQRRSVGSLHLQNSYSNDAASPSDNTFGEHFPQEDTPIPEDALPVVVPRPRILNAFMKWFAQELQKDLLSIPKEQTSNLNQLIQAHVYGKLHASIFCAGSLQVNADGDSIDFVRCDDSMTAGDRRWDIVMDRLQRLSPRDLGLTTEFLPSNQENDETMFQYAAGLMTGIPNILCPRQMLATVVISIDNAIAELGRRGGSTALTGEDMVPLFATVIKYSKIRQPFTCIAYMKAYGLAGSEVAGRNAYVLTTFQAAIFALDRQYGYLDPVMDSTLDDNLARDHSPDRIRRCVSGTNGSHMTQSSASSVTVSTTMKSSTYSEDKIDSENLIKSRVSKRVIYNRTRADTDVSESSDSEEPPDWLVASACVPLEVYIGDEERVAKEREAEKEALQHLGKWLMDQRLLEDTLSVFR